MSRLSVVSLCVFLCMMMLAVFSRADDVPPIPTVKTIDELSKLASVKLPSGTEVRVGMTEATEGAPWRLVFCLIADPNTPVANPSGDPEGAFGPLTVRIVKELTKSTEVSGDVEKRELRKPTGAYFYCTAVPVSAVGKSNVEVVASMAGEKDGPVLFRSTVEVKTAPPCYWHRLLDFDEKADAMTTKPTAARPRYSGMNADEWPADLKGDALLDGVDPVHALQIAIDWTVADPKLTVKSALDMIDSPKDHLLARWWLNDKPVIAPPAPSERMQQGWKISFGKEIKLPFALPKTLGNLKPGDRVTLQVMYCPAGVKPCGQTQTKMHDPIFVPRIIAHPETLPRLSDKLDITITPEMLK